MAQCSRLHVEAGHHVKRQEEEEEHRGDHLSAGRRRRDGTRPLGPVAERRVAAGDADGVEPARAELLVTRGGDETRPRGRARLPITDACTNTHKRSRQKSSRRFHCTGAWPTSCRRRYGDAADGDRPMAEEEGGTDHQL